SSATFFDATQGTRKNIISGKARIGDEESLRFSGVATGQRNVPWRTDNEAKVSAYPVCLFDNLHSRASSNVTILAAGAGERTAFRLLGLSVSHVSAPILSCWNKGQ